MYTGEGYTESGVKADNGAVEKLEKNTGRVCTWEAYDSGIQTENRSFIELV
jgi:hypothetical protein